MGPATLLLVIFAVLIAFWAGSRWRHNKRTWDDHKLTVQAVKTLRKLRWVTLKAALVALVATFIYLLGTGAISFASLDTKHKPAVTHPSPSSSPSSSPLHKRLHH